MSTPSLFVAWSIDAFSLFTASSIFAFAVAFSSSVAFGVWSISAFLASAALSIVAFASSFLTTVGWILLIESKPFDFAVSTPALFVAWSIAFLAVVTASSTFAFPPSLHLSRLVFGRFLLFSFRRFINRCFASSFLTTVGWILLIESKPFDFAVSTPSLFVAWSIDAFALFTASSTFAFRHLFFICRIRRLIDFRFLALAAFSIAVLLRLS